MQISDELYPDMGVLIVHVTIVRQWDQPVLVTLITLAISTPATMHAVSRNLLHLYSTPVKHAPVSKHSTLKIRTSKDETLPYLSACWAIAIYQSMQQNVYLRAK